MELHSLEAEQCLLGCILYDSGTGSNSEELLTSMSIKDFSSATHQIIFATLQDLFNKGLTVDLVTLTSELQQRGDMEKCGGIEYVVQLANSMPSNANYLQYKNIVKEFSRKRQLVRFAEYMKKEVVTQKTADELQAEFEDLLSRISMIQTSNDLEHISVSLGKEMERIRRSSNGEHDPFGVKMGFKELDECLWGMRPGNLLIVAGRPGSGKTAFALNALFNASVLQSKVSAFFSLEMTNEEIVRRLLAIGGAIDAAEILSGRIIKNEPTLVDRVSMLIKNGQLHIDDTTNQTPQQILAKAKKLKRRKGKLDLVVIDYLGIMKPPRPLNNPVAETGEIARAVKNIARQLQCPVLCLCQLNRNSETHKGGKIHELLMSDLRGSGEIEQEADVIMFLIDVTKPEDTTKTICLQMAKNRHGKLRNIKFEFQGNIYTFKEVCSNKNVPAKPPTQMPTQLPFDAKDIF